MIYFNKKLQPYTFAIIWMVLTALLQVVGQQYFRFESDMLDNLELWRLITAHAVHLNWMHWLLNSLGLLLLIAILRVRWRLAFWFKAVAILSVVISLALLMFNPQLKWYVGFSGVLYGLFILAGLLSYQKDKLISLLVLAIVIVKIIAEQVMGSAMSSQALLGAPVIIDAHAYGVIAGLCMAILIVTQRIKTN